MFCSSNLAGSVCSAGVADVNGTLLDVVSSAAVRGTTVDGMLVVKTVTGRVEFDKLIAHAGRARRSPWWRKSLTDSETPRKEASKGLNYNPVD